MRNLVDTGGVKYRQLVDHDHRTNRTHLTSISSPALAPATTLPSARSSGGTRRLRLRLAAAISGSVDDAADIAQEALVKAHRSLAKLADPAMVRPWMLRIVANEAKNHLRGRARRRANESSATARGWLAPCSIPRSACSTPTMPADWEWHSAGSAHVIGRCSPTATSPDCRRPRRPLHSMSPLAR